MTADWESTLTPDEKIAVAAIRTEIEAAREELVDAKRKFDRLCDELYLLAKAVRERMTSD